MKKLLLAGAVLASTACGADDVAIDAGPAPATTDVPTTTTTEAPPATVETTTTTEAPQPVVEPEPILCPSLSHPAHHSPCPPAPRRTATTEAYEPPSPQGSTTGRGSEPPAGDTPPDYIKQCESGGDYSAVNPSSGAGGAWQFMPGTWRSVGGTGRPQDATAAEQDYRASILWDNGRGASHWVCA